MRPYSSRIAALLLPLLAWLPVVAVLGWASLHGLSYLRLMRGPHSYEAASRWIFENIPKGSRIVGVHWDDKLPLHLPGLDPHLYGYLYEDRDSELQIYEPDTPQKLETMVSQLAGGDYVIFPTQRIPTSIPRVPGEYHYSTPLLQLLFAEKLGFRLVQTIKIEPAIGPFVFNTDLADESLSVYDHPKVTIFKNVERLTKDTIRSRILEPAAFAPLPTREEMLRMDVGGASVELAPGLLTEIFSVVIWLFVLELCAAVGYPVVRGLFSPFPDAGVGFARLCGLLISSYFVWVLHSFGVISGSPLSLWCVLVGVLVIFWVSAWRLFIPWAQQLRLPFALGAEGIFFSSFGLFLLMRAFQPEIFWGEKPMDFTFLNFFIRNPAMPPMDPWAAGETMHYYYYGFYIFGFLHKLTGVDSAIGYNLCISTIGALLCSGLYALICWLTNVRWIGMVGSVGLVVIGNFEWIRLLRKGMPVSFDFFWATSRLFSSPQITEYTSWSFLFGDLHPHLMALPLVVLALGLGVLVLDGSRGPQPLPLMFWGFAPLVWGLLLPTNSWDFITIGLVFGALFLVRAFSLGHQAKSFTAGLTAGGAVLAQGLLVFGLAWLAVMPGVESANNARIGYGWVTAPEFNSVWQILRHLGVWVVPLSVAGGFVLFHKAKAGQITAHGGAVAALVAALSVLLQLLSMANGNTNLPWPITLLAGALVWLGGYLVWGITSDPTLRIAGIFLGVAGMLVSFTEFVFLLDRMNTVFKFYNGIWLLLALATVALLVRVVRSMQSEKGATRVLAWGVVGVSSLALLIALCGGVLNLWAMLTFRRIDGPRPTLDGSAYLATMNRDEWGLIRWIQRQVEGTPVLLEAQGQSYGPFTRISMHTGLPTLLGWEYHVMQRGTSPQEVQERKQVIREIYTSPDLLRTHQLLRDYGVELVVVGQLESSTYGAAPGGLEKFESHPELFKVLTRSGKATLYATEFSRFVVGRKGALPETLPLATRPFGTSTSHGADGTH